MRKTDQSGRLGPASDAPAQERMLRVIGGGIASLYSDTLKAPLPASLAALVDELDAELLRRDRRTRSGR